MKKQLTFFLFAFCAFTFLAPASQALAKRKTCKVTLSILNLVQTKDAKKYYSQTIYITMIKTQRKGGTLLYRSTFWDGSKQKVEFNKVDVYKGSFKINKKHSCNHKRLWNIHYTVGKSPFVKVKTFKWLKGSSNKWSVTLR